MNKNAIKKFAIAARNRLIATVSDRAGMLGITKDKTDKPKAKGSGFEIYETPAGTENTLNRNQIEQRRKLVAEIESRGFDVVMEEVAYTWFNRICAIRFMEVNDYLPTRVRVLSSERAGKNEPDLLTEAPDVDLGFTEEERDWILTAKENNKLDDLFSMLFIKQCNKIHEILPELFEETEDYTEMLLSLSSFEKLRVVISQTDIINMSHLGARAFDEISGEVVQTTSFVTRNSKLLRYKGIYERLLEGSSETQKKKMFLSRTNQYTASQYSFQKIPGRPIAYTSRDVLRNYFLNDFFKDHCNTYSVTGSGKRPIYWLFDSGKQNGFKALIYLHRYDQDTVGRVRTDYLHKTQKAIEQAMVSAQYTLENSRNGSEKSKATKRISKYTKQLAEIRLYDEAIAHVASQRIPLDLDDGVKVNYAKFQGVEVSREGMKMVKVDLLAKI